MQLVVPEILSLARELSIGIPIAGLVLGLFLWLFGWWSHRFWIVLTITVAAGVYGLHESDMFHTHPMLAGLLLALCAGLVALSLARILAFAAGGLAGLLAAQVMMPSMTHLVPCFLVSGLVVVLLFRLWLMTLTSLVGCLLAVYAGLILLDRTDAIDAVTVAEQGTVIINWGVGGLTTAGIIVQYLLARRKNSKKQSKKKEPHLKDSWDILGTRTWKKPFRKAG